MGEKYTNIRTDGEITDANPDAKEDYFLLEDYQRDTDYWRAKLAEVIKNLSASPSTNAKIFYGGVIADAGSGKISISAGYGVGKDMSGKYCPVPLPAYSNVNLPSGWNDGRTIWVASKYDYKKTTDTRTHYNGEIYHYILEDAEQHDADAVNRPTNGFFLDASPGTDYIVWGAFTMTGTTYAEVSGERTSNIHLIQGRNLIQDYTVIGNVGDLAQQMAGHIWDVDEDGTDLALYKFASGALATDSKGSYNLTPIGVPTEENGIMGATATKNGAGFDGTSQKYSQDTLLDTWPANFYMDMWLKVDPSESGTPYLAAKLQTTLDGFSVYLNLAIPQQELVVWNTQISGIAYRILVAKLPSDYSTKYFHLALTWDSTYGKRIWINGKIVGVDAGATVLPPNLGAGGTDLFFMGESTTSFLQSLCGGLRFKNKLVTQKNLDLAIATRYAAPVVYPDNTYQVQAMTKEEGSNDFESQSPWQELKRTATYIYRYGFQYDSSDKLKLISRG